MSHYQECRQSPPMSSGLKCLCSFLGQIAHKEIKHCQQNYSER